MKLRILRGIWKVLGLLLLSACNFPGVAAPTPFVFPTPNQTLTAVFNPTPQATLPQPTPVFVTATPQATQPGEDATATTQPTATSAPVLPTATTTLALPTAAPTSTPAATQVVEAPDQRPDFSLTALYLDDAPNIDGTFGEWELERYSFSDVVYGAENWENPEDLRANVMLGWDEEFLYIAVRVHDDRYVQNASGEDIFKGDSLEILFDADVSGDFYVDDLDEDDYQLGISPGSPEPGEDMLAYLWYPSDEEGRVRDVEIGARSLENGYRVEAAIPWSVFGVEPDEGDHYGFAVSVSDNDKASTNVQQSMISTDPERMLTDPTTWGDLTLAD